MTDIDLDDLNKEDEIVTIKLPRRDAKILKDMIKREETYNHVTGLLKTHWVWVVGGGLLTLFLLWDQIKAFSVGVK